MERIKVRCLPGKVKLALRLTQCALAVPTLALMDACQPSNMKIFFWGGGILDFRKLVRLETDTRKG